MDYCKRDKETEVQKRIEEAYIKYSPRLTTFVRATVSSKSAVEDIVHDIFLEALKKHDVFIEHPNQIGWLYNTARFKIKEYQRKMLTVDMLDIAAEEVDIGSDENGYEEAELELYMEEILTAEERLRFIRFFLWGYSAEEIAELEGVTVNNIRVRLSRLKKKLLERT